MTSEKRKKMKLRSSLGLIFIVKINFQKLNFVVCVSSQSQFRNITIWNFSGKVSWYYSQPKLHSCVAIFALLSFYSLNPLSANPTEWSNTSAICRIV